MSFEHFPEARFRGSRDYLHSTDIYDEVLRGAALGGFSVERLVFQFRKRITCRPRYRFLAGDAAMADRAPASADCHFFSGSLPVRVDLLESDEPISERIVYDAAQGISGAKISGLVAELEFPGAQATPIEIVTALTVELHRVAFPPEQGKRWMDARMEFPFPLRREDLRSLRLEIVQSIAGAYTKTRITTASGPWGELLFILAPPNRT